MSYPPEVLEALFIMELGYNEWDDGAEDYVWRTLAQSAPELYQNLVRQHMYASGDIAPLTATPWTPDFHTTPEPQSGMLLAVGLAVLMLRRKRFSAFQAADSGQALSGPIVNVPVP